MQTIALLASTLLGLAFSAPAGLSTGASGTSGLSSGLEPAAKTHQEILDERWDNPIPETMFIFDTTTGKKVAQNHMCKKLTIQAVYGHQYKACTVMAAGSGEAEFSFGIDTMAGLSGLSGLSGPSGFSGMSGLSGLSGDNGDWDPSWEDNYFDAENPPFDDYGNGLSTGPTCGHDEL